MNRKEFFKLSLVGAGSVALFSKAKGLEYYPKTSDKKWAIIYSTWCGSSRDAAVWISEGMAGIANVFDIRENSDLSVYDNIVLGGSIRAAATSPEMQSFIAKNKDILKVKVRGYFAVCGNMQQPISSKQTTDFIDNHLAKLCEVNSLPSKVFLGRITKSLMDDATAASMAGQADYDNLKRTECMAFGKQVIDSITATKKLSNAFPEGFGLGQNYPQPFRQTTSIPYSIPTAGIVVLTVHALSGQKIETLVSEYQQNGDYNAKWDAEKYADGSYILKLTSENYSDSKEALLVR
jgi:menaquinone-dependent protoporphyrinogen IX oxidase